MKTILGILSIVIASAFAAQTVAAKTGRAGGSVCAYFSGEKIVGIDHRFVFSDFRCFPTEADCKAWLYRVQSDWPFEQNVRFCHRGR
jgi:hypothetical protein